MELIATCYFRNILFQRANNLSSYLHILVHLLAHRAYTNVSVFPDVEPHHIYDLHDPFSVTIRTYGSNSAAIIKPLPPAQ